MLRQDAPLGGGEIRRAAGAVGRVRLWEPRRRSGPAEPAQRSARVVLQLLLPHEGVLERGQQAAHRVEIVDQALVELAAPAVRHAVAAALHREWIDSGPRDIAALARRVVQTADPRADAVVAFVQPQLKGRPREADRALAARRVPEFEGRDGAIDRIADGDEQALALDIRPAHGPQVDLAKRRRARGARSGTARRQLLRCGAPAKLGGAGPKRDERKYCARLPPPVLPTCTITTPPPDGCSRRHQFFVGCSRARERPCSRMASLASQQHDCRCEAIGPAASPATPASAATGLFGRIFP